MSHVPSQPVRHALPVELEEAEGGIAQVAAEAWASGWPADGALPDALPGALRGPLPQVLDDALGGVGRASAAAIDRVRASWLVAPVAIAIASRLYSSLLLSLVPLFQPNLAIPRLTGFTSPFLQWDSQWYITIANWGYHAAPMQAGPFGGRHDFAFFPAWPELLRATEALGFQVSEIAPLLAAGLFVLASPLIYLVLERQFGRTAALWGVVLIAFSPPAYVLSMAYSEPLFLLLVAALFATRSGPVRVVLGLALGVTRLTGVAVAAAQGLRWLRNWRDWRALVTAAAIGVAFAGWWVFIWQLTGDPAGWFQGSAQWGHILGLAAIGQAITEWSNVRLGDLVFVALILAGAVLLARRNIELGSYAVIAILLSIAGAPVESMPRHALVAFPAFGMIASRLGTRGRIALALIFAGLQANYVLLSFVGPQPFAP
ncbi:MAG TPA: hypothetical protein VGJ17_04010 [Candidatus Limnocylindrales bacterium]